MYHYAKSRSVRFGSRAIREEEIRGLPTPYKGRYRWVRLDGAVKKPREIQGGKIIRGSLGPANHAKAAVFL